MDALKALREQAAQKRDDAFKAARDDYKRTLRQIDDLALRLGGEAKTARGTPAKRIIVDLILDYMPKDRPFSVRELMPILRRAVPTRHFQENTVRTMFKRLIDQQLVRKVCKSDHGFMLYAAPECPAEDAGPMAAMSLTEAAEYVLRDRGPLRPVEIVLAVQALGYRSGANQRTMLSSVSMALKRQKERFALNVDGKWSTV